ncbi:MAG: hypothetical protein AB1671_27020 [Thermodesulfobacteriota bacterium]
MRASKKLRNEELLVTSLGPTILRKHLDDVPLWRGDHVAIKQLIDDFGRYLYLPRLKDSSVLLGAIRDGLGLLTWEQDSFAYADSYDDVAQRYRGLRGGQTSAVSDTDAGLLVRPAIARRQLTAPAQPVEGYPRTVTSTPRLAEPASPSVSRTGPVAPPRPRRYHGTVTLDPTRAGRDASRIADEVISHLVGIVGASVRITLEIEAEIPDGVPETVVRVVTENSRTLKFTSHGFEHE